MGTCASVAKAVRGEVGGAPPPDPPKEETTTTTTEVTEVQAAEKEATGEGGEKKTECGNDSAKPEDENKEGERRSLGSLLESEEVKESPPKPVKISSEVKTVAEEQESKALSFSDKAAGEQAEPTENAPAPYVAPVARPTEEEKETEKN